MQPAQLDDHLRKTGDHLRALATLDKPSRVLWRACSKTIDYLEYEPSPIIRVRSMAINPDDLQRRLCEQLCASVRVEPRPDGEVMLEADFEFPDGDRYPIYLSETPGGVRLSDKGDTPLTRIYELTHYSRSRAAAAFSSLASSEDAPKA